MRCTLATQLPKSESLQDLLERQGAAIYTHLVQDEGTRVGKGDAGEIARDPAVVEYQVVMLPVLVLRDTPERHMLKEPFPTTRRPCSSRPRL